MVREKQRSIQESCFRPYVKKLCKEMSFDLKLKVTGDLIVDCHHTIEDVGIVLGEAIKEAIGDKMSIKDMATLFFLWMKHLSCVP